MSTLAEIIDMAVEQVDEIDLAGAYPEDQLHEIADGSVPVYNGTLLELAASSYDLALVEPEIGPAFDGSSTPVNIIAANVYEAVYNAAAERLREREEWFEEIDWDWDEAVEMDELRTEAREIIHEACERWYSEQR